MQPGNTGKSDWETEQEKRDWREADTPAPPAPGTGALLPFFVSSASDYRFFVDAASIAPGTRSPAGAQRVAWGRLPGLSARRR